MSVINTNAFVFYNKLLEGYQKENVDKGMDHPSNNIFVHAAINQAAANADNPFPVDSEAYKIYFTMMKHHSLWRLGGPDRKVSRRRFLANAVLLAEIGMENPFEIELEPVIEISTDTISLEALAEAEYAREDAKAIASGTYIPVQEPVMTFTGVFSEDEDDVIVTGLEVADEKQPQTESACKYTATTNTVADKKPGLFKRLMNKIRKKENA